MLPVILLLVHSDVTVQSDGRKSCDLLPCKYVGIVGCRSVWRSGVNFSVTATDNCSANVVSVPASGSFFAVGTTTVTSTATDRCRKYIYLLIRCNSS
ncbi:MAG: HYR domain-containing protein [Bacteroidia bacterium]